MDAPPTIDDELPAENTTIDGSQRFLPEPPAPEGRWEERTIAEKGAAKRSAAAAPPAAGPPRAPSRAAPAPAAMAAGSAEAKPAPAHLPEDSARVLVDFDDSRADPAKDMAISSMPTAISPNALVAQTRPVGAAGPAPGRLVVIGGSDRGREFVLINAETTLGRGADNDIILTDIAVSRRHIVLINDGARYGIRDLSSGNGTLINGIRIQGDVFIHDGDQFELGNTLIRFEHPGSRSAMTSPPIGPPLAPAPVLPAPSGVPLPMPMAQPTAPPPAMLGGPAPGSMPSGSFVPAGMVVAPPPYPPPSGMFPASSAPYSPLPTPFVPPPQGPSAAAMDLFRNKRKLLLWVGGGLLGFAVLLTVVLSLSGGSDKSHAVQSTEAATSPALNALLSSVDQPGAKPSMPAPNVTPAPSPTVAPPPAPSPSPTVAPPPAPAPSPPVVASADPPKADPPRPLIKKPEPKPLPKRPDPKPIAKKPDPKPPAQKPLSGSAAEKQAAALYRDRQFDRAAEVLNDAAAKESGATADRLEATARDYSGVGVALAKADANAQGSPTVAFAAYQQALSLDARSGHGLQAPYIKAQLAKVVPRAALAYVNTGKLEQARAACDSADQLGAGDDPTVQKVRGQLEARAKDMYQQGLDLAKKSPDDAKALWRRVLKIVPAESTWYTKSYAALNKTTHTTTDEDE
jgi:hypothetical protein